MAEVRSVTFTRRETKALAFLVVQAYFGMSFERIQELPDDAVEALSLHAIRFTARQWAPGVDEQLPSHAY